MRVRITAGDRQAEAEIRDFHDQIIRLILDGKDLETHPLLFNVLQDKEPDRANVEEWIKGLILNELVDQLDDEDRKFLKEGVDVNMRLADHGLEYGSGLGIGKAFEPPFNLPCSPSRGSGSKPPMVSPEYPRKKQCKTSAPCPGKA